jgi:hypothetical protein
MIKRNWYLLFLIFAATACTEKIDLTLDESFTRLVVDGSISADTTPSFITLTETADYFYNAPSPKVVNATVVVTDGDTSIQLTETIPGISGIYTTPDGFSGQPGKNYTLDIQLAEPIDEKTAYTSTCKLNPVTRLDSISTVFEPDWGASGFWQVKVYALDPGDAINYYMLKLFRNGVLWSDSITKVSTTDDTFFNGNYINGAAAFFINNENKSQTLHPGDTITVQMSAITKEYFNFINQVQQAGFSIPFFSGPPANVEGNISDGAVGFFAAYQCTYATCLVK